MKPAGWVFALLSMLMLALVLHSGVVNAALTLASREDDRVLVGPDVIFGGNAATVDAETRGRAAGALRLYDFSSSIAHGGIGLSSSWQNTIDVRRAWLHCVRDEFDQAEAIMRAAHAREPTESTTSALAMILRSQDNEAKQREALSLYETSLAEHPEYGIGLFGDYEPVAIALGRIDELIAVHRARLARDPNNLLSLRGLCMILMQTGQLDEGLSLNARWIEQEPGSTDAHRLRALALADLGQMKQAIAEMRIAAELAPEHDAFSSGLLADMLDAAGQREEAAAIREKLGAQSPPQSSRDVGEPRRSPPNQ